MNRIETTLIAGVLILGFLWVQDCEAVAISTSDTVYADPGTVATQSVVIYREPGDPDSLRLVRHLPAGWTAVGGQSVVAIPESGRTLLLEAIRIPAVAAADVFEPSLTAMHPKTGTLLAQHTWTIRVNTKRNVQLTALTRDRLLVAGNRDTLRFRCHNHGNRSESLEIDVRAFEQESAHPIPGHLSLEKGQSTEIRVPLDCDADLNHRQRRIVHLAIRSAHGDTVLAQAQAVVRMLPRVSGVDRPYHTLDGTAGAGILPSSRGMGLQADVHLRGYLDEQDSRYLNIHLRGPDRYDASLYGRRERYSLHYRSPQSDVFIGDRSYSLSRLTESYLYGRGMEVSRRFGNHLVGSFVQKTIWYSQPQQTWAGYWRLKQDSMAVGGHLMHIQEGNRHGDVLGIQGRFMWLGMWVGGEWVNGLFNSRDEQGWRVKLDGSWNRLKVHMETLQTSKHYPGQYQNARVSHAWFRMPVSKRFTLHGRYRLDRRNLYLDPRTLQAPDTELARLSAQWTLASHDMVRLELQSLERIDRMPVKQFNDVRRTVQMVYSHHHPLWSVQAQVEAGQLTNRLRDLEGGFYRTRLSAGFKPGHHYSLHAYVDYNTANELSSNALDNVMTGVQAEWTPRPGTWLRFSWQNQFQLVDYYQQRNLLELDASYRFSNDHQILLRLRRSLEPFSIEDRETVAMLKYSLPLSVPLRRRQSIGRIQGCIRDLESGRPVAGAILTLLDKVAVTDKKGRYTFVQLEPGAYTIQVDRHSLPDNRVAVSDMAMPVQVRGGETVTVDYTLMQAASVSGSLRLDVSAEKYANLENPQLTQEKRKQTLQGAPGVYLELCRGTDLYRAVTDAGGDFRFTGLAPGTWTLTVRHADLPEGYQLDSESVDLTLEPGEQSSLDLTAHPPKRTIRWKETGTSTLIGGKE
jgi:hypothetical protein